jgi:hypothetical protein
VIIQVIKDYNLGSRIGYFVTDNAYNNDTAIEIVVGHFFPHMTEKKRRSRRLRCLGHVINLSAKAFLYGKEYDAFEKDIENVKEHSELLKELNIWRKRGPVGKLHNVVTFICRSPQRRDKFADIKQFSAKDSEDFNHLKLIVDNATRWNSLYLMIERALKLRDRIDRFCIDYADTMHGSSTKKAQTDDELAHLLKNDTLNGDDWIALSEVVFILRPFYDLTKRAEGDRGVLSDYLTTLNKLLAHVRERRDDLILRDNTAHLSTPATNHLRACIVNCWTKLDEYFAIVNDTPAHYASVVTNPSMKWFYFEHKWKDAVLWEDATNAKDWLPGGKAALQTLWDEYREMPIPSDISSGSVPGAKRARSPTEFELDTDMTLLYGPDQEEDPLDVWNKAYAFRLDKKETLPQFWIRQLKQKSVHRLAQMGLDMAAIPAMSSDCERVFSQGKLLITGQRNRLKADIIEATQCLRMWMIMDRKKLGKWKGQKSWTTPTELRGDDDGEVDGLTTP